MADAGGAEHHGILKRGDSHKKVTGIHWDEPTLAEHDKDRGTRMKIDEPKTPYHHEQDSEFGGPASTRPSPPRAWLCACPHRSRCCNVAMFLLWPPARPDAQLMPT